MRKRFSSLVTVLNTLGSLVGIQGVLLLVPVIFCLGFGEYNLIFVFSLPALGCFLISFLLTRLFKRKKIYYLQSLLICGLAWIVLSFFAALPFFLSGSCNYLDAYFETVSGFTTTGITIFTNIESLAGSILFWRSLIQWTGGLGILTLFLAITFKSNNAYFQLFSAESHKIDSARPTPSIKKTIISLWLIYIILTSSEFLILAFLGLSPFDALCHSLTTLSTGGFSTYDASIDHFRQAGYLNYQAIEYVITLFMFLGGVNFLLHYLTRFGRFREVLANVEFRYYFFLILLFSGLIMLDHYNTSSSIQSTPEEVFRTSLFTTVSLVTTTGYGTTDINASFFPAMSRQLLLILMFIGGSVGSTAGGVQD